VTDKRATATPAKLDSILQTLQNLTARIEDSRLEDGPEKQRMREHAERLMREYRVTEDELNQVNLDSGRAPISVPGSRKFRLYRMSSEYGWVYNRIFNYCVVQAECRGTGDYERDEDGWYWAIGTVVGYEGDTRYAEALYTEARAYFATRMEPTVDSRLSDADNVYRLRSAGIERGRIGEMMGWGLKAHVKVTKIYKDECARRGEPATMTGKGNSMKTFREAFASQFPMTLWDEMRRALLASDGGSGELVLKSRKQAVDEKFYEMFPDLRPIEVATTSKEPVKKGKPRTWTQRDEAAYRRMYESPAALLGRAAADSAAREVNIHGAKSADRLED
jgi:hypothetical protein